jgi:hypothetical protein
VLSILAAVFTVCRRPLHRKKVRILPQRRFNSTTLRLTSPNS